MLVNILIKKGYVQKALNSPVSPCITFLVCLPLGGIIYRTAGEWNGAIEITREGTNQSQSFDTKKMRVIRKRVRSINMQEDNESRRYD